MELPHKEFENNEAIKFICVHKNENILIIGTKNRTIKLIDLSINDMSQPLKEIVNIENVHDDTLSCFFYDRLKNWLVLGSIDRSAKVLGLNGYQYGITDSSYKPKEEYLFPSLHSSSISCMYVLDEKE